MNTDKYEGHIEGEWTVDIDSYDKYGSIRPVEISRHERGQKGWTLIATIRHRKPLHALEYEKANAQLIADAPLLLAEVKRLRKGIQDALYLFQEAGNPKMSDKKRLETICEFLVEVIE